MISEEFTQNPISSPHTPPGLLISENFHQGFHLLAYDFQNIPSYR